MTARLRPAPLLACALLALVGLGLAGCSRCVLCYEDDWQRNPFPGQPTQQIPTPDVRGGQPVR